MSLYWLTDSFVTSVRFYAEAANEKWTPAREGMPQIPTPNYPAKVESAPQLEDSHWIPVTVRLDQQGDAVAYELRIKNPKNEQLGRMMSKGVSIKNACETLGKMAARAAAV